MGKEINAESGRKSKTRGGNEIKDHGTIYTPAIIKTKEYLGLDMLWLLLRPK